MDELVSSSSNTVEAKRQKLSIDWRAEKPIFDEQMSYFYMNEEMADLEFVFNRQNKITVCLLHNLFFILHYPLCIFNQHPADFKG